MSFNWVFYFAKKLIYRSKNNEQNDEVLVGSEIAKRKPEQINPLWLAIPAIFDLFGQLLRLTALTMMPLSTL